MKFFRKKKTPQPSAQSNVAKSELEQTFYSRSASEIPLDEAYRNTATRQTQRTSRHSPGRRRETSNRASNIAIFLLLFRTAAIVIILAVSFFALKWGLNRLNEPSDEELLLAETSSSMESVKPSIVFSSAGSVPQELAVTPDVIQQRLQYWEDAARDFRSADAFNRRGLDEDAVQRLGLVLKNSPTHRGALKMLLDIYIQRGLHAEAVPLCIRLLDQDGLQPELQLTLLQSLHLSGQIDSAQALAGQMLLNQPNHLPVLAISAEGYIQMGDTNSALPLFEKILTLDNQHTNALKHCGEIYFDRADYPRAATYYTDLIQQDPQLPYYLALACCYAQQTNAGQTVLSMGQAANRFSPGEVAPWLKNPMFNVIRESVDFRSFSDRLVGIDARKSIEAISKRTIESTTTEGEEPVLPKQPDIFTPKLRKPPGQ